MTLLEVIVTLERGWKAVGHPANLEEAIRMGMARGNGLYIFHTLTFEGHKMDWFGLWDGAPAGCWPYGWEASGVPRMPGGVSLGS